MKRFGLATVMMVVVSLPVLAQGRGQGFGKGPGAGAGAGAGNPGMCQNLAALPVEPLSASEASSILYMREEEKLARDVYRGLYEKWGLNVFTRIATSEQHHMDAIKMLITRYELSDPVKDDTPGVFTNKDLASLYNQLMNEGAASEIAALKVGAKIEDLDIHDLAEASKQADSDDIKLVFGNLSRASGNHLRAFTSQLNAAGETYVPQFLTAAEYDEIISAAVAPGRGRGNGRGWRGGNGQGMRFGTPRCLQNN